MKLPPRQALRDHARMLLDRFKLENKNLPPLELRYSKGLYADRRVYYPRINSLVGYIVALHEIGHLAVSTRSGKLLDEAAVWIWVRGVSLAWNEECDQLVSRCISSYASDIEVSAKSNHFFHETYIHPALL